MARSYFNYESMLRWRAEWLEKQLTGKLLVRSTDRDFEASRQALLKRYVTFEFTPEVASINWSVFLNDVRAHSGRHRHQGGLVLFVIEGSGSTDIDGTRYDWGAEDLLILPIRPDGVAYQHFNDDPSAPAFLFACEPNLAFIFDLDRGSSFEELEDAPEFKDESSGNDIAAKPPVF